MRKIVIRHCQTCTVYPARAVRVAALLDKELGIKAETVGGKHEEFSVWVDDRLVAEKSNSRAPGDRQVLEAVRAAFREVKRT